MLGKYNWRVNIILFRECSRHFNIRKNLLTPYSIINQIPFPPSITNYFFEKKYKSLLQINAPSKSKIFSPSANTRNQETILFHPSDQSTANIKIKYTLRTSTQPISIINQSFASSDKRYHIFFLPSNECLSKNKIKPSFRTCSKPERRVPFYFRTGSKPIYI